MLKKVLAAVLVLPLLMACEDEEEGFSFSRSAENRNLSVVKANIDSLSILEAQYPNRSRFQRLDTGHTRACFYRSDVFLGGVSSQELDCWGERLLGDYVGAINKGENKTLAVGDAHVCTIRSDFGGRGVGCDGGNEYGESESPESKSLQYQEDSDPSAWTGHWTYNAQVTAAGAGHSCLLDEYGVYCWGDNSAGQTDVPALSNPLWVAAGGNTSCAIDEHQALHCWGDLGMDRIPSNLTLVSQVDVGHDFICAVQNGDLFCWGNTENWDVDPNDYVNVQHISAGYDHACVLDQTAVDQPLAYHCFGKDNVDTSPLTLPEGVQTNIQVLGSEIQTIAAGKGFTCASMNYDGYEYQNMTEHTAVECWGANDNKQSAAPKFLCLGFHQTASIDNQGIESDTENAFCPQFQ